jgi:hypothetical protein
MGGCSSYAPARTLKMFDASPRRAHVPGPRNKLAPVSPQGAASSGAPTRDLHRALDSLRPGLPVTGQDCLGVRGGKFVE